MIRNYLGLIFSLVAKSKSNAQDARPLIWYIFLIYPTIFGKIAMTRKNKRFKAINGDVVIEVVYPFWFEFIFGEPKIPYRCLKGGTVYSLGSFPMFGYKEGFTGEMDINWLIGHFKEIVIG